MNKTKISKFDNNYIIIDERHDPIYGRIKLIQSENTKLILKEKIFNNINKFKTDLKNAEDRFKIKNKNIQRLIDYSYSQKKGLYYINVYFELNEINLYDLISIRRANSEEFEIEEWEKIFKDIMNAIVFLQKNKKAHCDIRLIYITYNPIENNYKLNDRLGNPLQPSQIQFNYIKNKKDLYIPPNYYNSLKNKENCIKLNQYSTDIYALGLIILECGLNKSIQNVYKGKKFNLLNLKKYIVNFKSKYRDSYLTENLNNILENNENFRLRSVDILRNMNKKNSVCIAKSNDNRKLTKSFNIIENTNNELLNSNLNWKKDDHINFFLNNSKKKKNLNVVDNNFFEYKNANNLFISKNYENKNTETDDYFNQNDKINSFNLINENMMNEIYKNNISLKNKLLKNNKDLKNKDLKNNKKNPNNVKYKKTKENESLSSYNKNLENNKKNPNNIKYKKTKENESLSSYNNLENKGKLNPNNIKYTKEDESLVSCNNIENLTKNNSIKNIKEVESESSNKIKENLTKNNPININKTKEVKSINSYKNNKIKNSKENESNNSYKRNFKRNTNNIKNSKENQSICNNKNKNEDNLKYITFKNNENDLLNNKNTNWNSKKKERKVIKPKKKIKSTKQSKKFSKNNSNNDNNLIIKNTKLEIKSDNNIEFNEINKDIKSENKISLPNDKLLTHIAEYEPLYYNLNNNPKKKENFKNNKKIKKDIKQENIMVKDMKNITDQKITNKIFNKIINPIENTSNPKNNKINDNNKFNTDSKSYFSFNNNFKNSLKFINSNNNSNRNINEKIIEKMINEDKIDDNINKNAFLNIDKNNEIYNTNKSNSLNKNIELSPIINKKTNFPAINKYLNIDLNTSKNNINKFCKEGKTKIISYDKNNNMKIYYVDKYVIEPNENQILDSYIENGNKIMRLTIKFDKKDNWNISNSFIKIKKLDQSFYSSKKNSYLID